MVSQTVEIYTVNITLTIEKNGGQTLRRLEIYANEITIEIDVYGSSYVKALQTFEKPSWGQWFGDKVTGLKNLLSFASNLEDVIIYVDEGRDPPTGYDIFITITISHKDKKTVVHILARSNLDEPYLHEVNVYGKRIEAINIS